jgi:hypothetical protein
MQQRFASGAEVPNEGSTNCYVKQTLTPEEEKKEKIAEDIIIELSGGENGSFSSHEQSIYYATLIQTKIVTLQGTNAIYCGILFKPPSFTRPMAILSSEFITSLLGKIDSALRVVRKSKQFPKDTTSEEQYVCHAVNKIFDMNSIEYRICLIELYNKFVEEEEKQAEAEEAEE